MAEPKQNLLPKNFIPNHSLFCSREVLRHLYYNTLFKTAQHFLLKFDTDVGNPDEYITKLAIN